MSPPHSVEQHQQAVHLVALLNGRQQGHDVLIFGGLGRGGQNLVALDLSYNGQGVDGPPLRPDGGGAHIHDLLLALVAALLASGLRSLLRLIHAHTLPKCRLDSV